jgi:hypothetical protein
MGHVMPGALGFGIDSARTSDWLASLQHIRLVALPLSALSLSASFTAGISALPATATPASDQDAAQNSGSIPSS